MVTALGDKTAGDTLYNKHKVMFREGEDSPNYLCNDELLPLMKKVVGPRWIILRNDS